MVETGDHLRLMRLRNKVKNVFGQPLSAPEARQAAGDIGRDDRLYLSQPVPEWERAWQLTGRLVAQVRTESEALGARVVLVALSNAGQVPTDLQQMRENTARLGEADLFFPERRMRSFAEREGVEAVLLAEPFAAHAATNGEHPARFSQNATRQRALERARPSARGGADRRAAVRSVISAQRCRHAAPPSAKAERPGAPLPTRVSPCRRRRGA
jgi:hypothetical protein